MKVAVVALTERGAALAGKVSGVLAGCGNEVEVYAMPEAARKNDGIIPLDRSLGEVTGELFSRCQGLVMIMALGIVVRSIAPYIKDKRTDPAVVAMDEGGEFVISVLSGHMGGANDLARLIAGSTGSAAVITTATDVNGVPALDVMARDLKMEPEPWSAVKKINGALAGREKVYLYSQYSIVVPESELICVGPWEQRAEVNGAWRILVTGDIGIVPGEKDILLRPRNIAAGIGCKKGAGCEEIINQIKIAMELAGRSMLCIKALATVSVKAGEEGIVRAAGELGVPLLSFDRDQINDAVKNYGLSQSEFVLKKMGVGGVCEPVALLACRNGKLLLGKRKGPGITVALAEESSGWWE
ncbi:MAG: cobalt-precorrin 5A hydrolase [Bacillota bacterium]